MIIHLEKNEPMFHDINWVFKETGDYKEDELVTVLNVNNSDQEAAYYAKYIKTGENP